MLKWLKGLRELVNDLTEIITEFLGMSQKEPTKVDYGLLAQIHRAKKFNRCFWCKKPLYPRYWYPYEHPIYHDGGMRTIMLFFIMCCGECLVEHFNFNYVPLWDCTITYDEEKGVEVHT